MQLPFQLPILSSLFLSNLISPKVECDYFITRPISFHSRSSDLVLYAKLSESKVKDLDGSHSSTFLTTLNEDGSKIDSSSRFDFYRCDSNYIGYQTIRSKYNTYFGHVTPATQSHSTPKHCLTLRSKQIGPTSLVVDSECSFSDNESQLRNFFAFQDSPVPNLDFVGHKNDGTPVKPNAASHKDEFFWTIDSSKSGKVYLHSGAATEDQDVYDLYF